MAQAMSGAARWAQRFGRAAVLLFLVGPLLAHLWIVPAIAGFVLFDLGGLLGILALVCGAVAAFRGAGSGSGLAVGAVVTLAFLAIALPSGKVPPINDITTDATNPPQFVKAGSLGGNAGTRYGVSGHLRLRSNSVLGIPISPRSR